MKKIGLIIWMIGTMHAQDLPKSYQTLKGETLKDIADKFKVDYMELVKANLSVSRWPAENTTVVIPQTGLVKKDLKPVDMRPDVLLINTQKDTVHSVVSQQVASQPEAIQVKYILHKVVQKETLFSLSKLYNVSTESIMALNPAIGSGGVKMDQQIKIPQPNPTKILKGGVSHIVKASETVFAISQMYHLTVAQLIAMNPIIEKEGLKAGMVLDVPFYAEDVLKVNDNLHKVAEGETLYSIAKKYHSSVNELLKLNPALQTEALKMGDLIIVPTQESKVNVIQGGSLNMVKSDTVETPNYVLQRSLQVSPFKDTEFNIDNLKIKKLKILMMLPFNLSKNDSIPKEKLFSNATSLPSIVADFYLGAQIAVDSLKSIGADVEVKIFDTEKSVDFISQNLTVLKEFNPNIIIGPFYSSNVDFVSKNFENAMLYFPMFSKKQHEFTAKNIIKLAVNEAKLKDKILKYVKNTRSDQQLVLVGLEKDKMYLEQLKTEFIVAGNGIQITDITIITPVKGFIAKEQLYKRLNLNKENWIVLCSSDNTLSSDVLNVLGSTPNNLKIKVFAFEKTDFIDKNSYAKLAKTHFTYGGVEEDINYNQILDFTTKYKIQNEIYPSKYAVRGGAVVFESVYRTIEADFGLPTQWLGIPFDYKDKYQITNENQAIMIHAIDELNNQIKIQRVL